jgi:hypothetical protein
MAGGAPGARYVLEKFGAEPRALPAIDSAARVTR